MTDLIPTAKAQRWDPAEVVRVLLAEEPAGRDAANLRTRRKRAGFPAGKTFGDWDETASSISRQVQDSLKTLEWISRKENLCVCGPSGTGKSDFTEALGQAAVEAGRTVAWFAIEDLGSCPYWHRSLRGALVGHFAAVEVTSSPGSRRLAEAMRRTGAGPAAERFYDEHVEADAVHEQIVRREVVDGLLKDEPDLEPDVAFGIGATGLLDSRLARYLLAAWREDRSALPAPLPHVRARKPARSKT
ncbi:iron-containing redox enzyme family protein [Streptomyces decoyicus]|uniref:iron-containing redox enzyme family protein n=1 Tax=Streptomyces decoyicus TaxID=249567 RepID=UPI0033D4E51D